MRLQFFEVNGVEMQRPWIWILVAAPMVLMISFFFLMLSETGDRESRPAAVRVSGDALIGGPFSLVDHTGRNVTDADYRGRAMLIYFGYSYCPDVCPFSLQIVNAAMNLLTEEEQARFQPILITVDPDRDTVEHLATYVTSPAFPNGLVGLTGSHEQIDAVIAAYRVVAMRAPDDGGDPDAYLMDHSSFTYLMNEIGQFEDVFSHGSNPADMADRLRAYLESTPEG
jgi:protein SCO1/2